MQLSDTTIKTLENFATINGSIVIRKTPDGQTGTVVRTIDRQGVIYAETKIPETINTNVSIWDLKSFLSIITSLETPEVEFGNESLQIVSGTSKTKIGYAESSVIIHPQKEFNAPAGDFSFQLTQNDLAKVLNMGSILQLPHLQILTENGKVILRAIDAMNPNSNKSDVEIEGSATGDHSVFIKRENIKMMPGDYDVDICVGKAAIFKNAVNTDLLYSSSLENIAV